MNHNLAKINKDLEKARKKKEKIVVATTKVSRIPKPKKVKQVV
jgi:hypothetical protein